LFFFFLLKLFYIFYTQTISSFHLQVGWFRVWTKYRKLFFARLKRRLNEWVMQRNPRSPSATSFEVAFGRAWFENKTREARLQPRLKRRLDVHGVQRKPEKTVCSPVCTPVRTRLYQIPIFLVPSGRPLIAVRTTRVLPSFFAKTSLHSDESASRSDALNLIRVLWIRVYVVFKLGVSSGLNRSLQICLGDEF
jgi:hypothetical protein